MPTFTLQHLRMSLQEKLLSNVDHKLTNQQQCMLDVYKVNDNPSLSINKFVVDFSIDGKSCLKILPTFFGRAMKFVLSESKKVVFTSADSMKVC